MDHSREAARLKRRRDELRLELATVQRELEATLTLAGEELIEAGIPRLPIDGSIVYFRTVATIHPSRGRVTWFQQPLTVEALMTARRARRKGSR